MADLKNELSWSFSRKRLFDSCRRGYYYSYYLKWNGWLETAPDECRQAYRLCKMTTLSSYAGSLVHEGIRDALNRFRRNGMVTAPSECVDHARARWKSALAESHSRRWLKDPKRFVCFQEEYYAVPDFHQRVARCWDIAEVCLTSFWSSKTWEGLLKARKERWLATDADPFKTYPIEGIDVYIRPDFGYDASQPAGARLCRVFDWKTGRPRDSDVLQMRFYALGANPIWGFEPECVRGRLLYLYPEPVEQDVEITLPQIEDARRALIESYDQMKSVLEVPEENIPLDISHFPTTSRLELCYGCNFREMCDSASPSTPPAAPPECEDYEFDPFE